MNSDILYQIGNQIDNHITFFNFIISFKGIKNKDLLIKQKKIQFAKVIMVCYANGQIQEKYYILPNNKKEGLYQRWHKNGQLNEQYNYINGNIEGLYQTWFENGQIHYYVNFINNKKEGLYESWYVDGTLYMRGYYNNDIPTAEK
jgi:antitoxin component YwqK of YwqJK toxin-antitoxin module